MLHFLDLWCFFIYYTFGASFFSFYCSLNLSVHCMCNHPKSLYLVIYKGALWNEENKSCWLIILNWVYTLLFFLCLSKEIVIPIITLSLSWVLILGEIECVLISSLNTNHWVCLVIWLLLIFLLLFFFGK